MGKSSGWASFTGLAEGKDLEELVQWGLGAVTSVVSVVLMVRAEVCLVDEISLWLLGLFARSSYNVPSPRSPCTDQNLTSVTFIPSGSEVFLDLIQRGDLHRSPKQTYRRP